MASKTTPVEDEQPRPAQGDAADGDGASRAPLQDRPAEGPASEAGFDFDFILRDDEVDESGLIKHRHRRSRARTALKAAACALAVVLVACAGAGIVLARSASSLKSQASGALAQLASVQSSVESYDFDAASASAQALSDSADAMLRELDSPLWGAASALPVVGSDVEGARELVELLQDASANALVPLTGALAETPIQTLVVDKTIDLEALTGLLSTVQEVAPAMQRCADAAAALPEMHVEQLSSAADTAKEKLGQVNEAFQAASELVPVAGSLLGADGDRLYLLVAQNSAELRASGGFPGSVGTLSISGGTVSFGSFQRVYDVLGEDTPASVGITDEEKALFYGYTRYTWDNSFNPDFERVGAIWAASYEERNGAHIDGVVSLTPSVVQRLLAALGASVTLSDGTTLDGQNATKVLEHDLYWKYLSDEATVEYSTGSWLTDALFSEAAWRSSEEVHNNLTAQTLGKLAGVLEAGGEDREVLVWMADPDEQAAMESIGVTGSLNAATQRTPTLGVFANIWFGSKFGWWFGLDTEVVGSRQSADGTRTYQVRTTVSNYLTSEEQATGGTYILGSIFDSGLIEPFVYLYAPAGCSIEDVQASNGAQFTATQYKGLQVLYTANVSSDFDTAQPSFAVYPGQDVQVTYDVVVPAGVEGDLEVTTVPTLQQYR